MRLLLVLLVLLVVVLLLLSLLLLRLPPSPLLTPTPLSAGGIGVSFCSLIDVFVGPGGTGLTHVTPQQVGWLGFTVNCAGMCAPWMVAFAVRWANVGLKPWLQLSCLGMGLCVVAFGYATYFASSSFALLLALTLAFGLSYGIFGPISEELAADITFPVPEEVSATLVMSMFNAGYFLCMSVLSTRLSGEVATHTSGSLL